MCKRYGEQFAENADAITEHLSFGCERPFTASIGLTNLALELSEGSQISVCEPIIHRNSLSTVPEQILREPS